jgi:DNA-binding transcriptional LysR family regulator
VNAVITNLDLDQLKTFLAIAETGSFTKAAEDVNKTQSAVSMQMKRLEETLGRSLFERDGRGSRFTLEGERFIEQARRLVAVNDEILSSYSRPQLSGAVRFGTPDDYAEFFLPDALAKFARTHPMVMVDVECLSTANLIERLNRGELDISVVTFCGKAHGDVVRREKLHWVGSARHGAHSLQTLPIAAAEIGCAWRKAALDGLDNSKRDYRVAFTSANRAAIDSAVLAGIAIAAMPEICIKPGMRVLGETEGLPPLGEIEIGLMRRSGKLPQAADALARHITESFSKPDLKIISAA